MSNNNQTPNDENYRAQLTAYALDELPSAEAATIAARLSSDADAHAWVAQVRQLRGILQSNTSNSPILGSDRIRTAVEASLRPTDSIHGESKIDSKIASRISTDSKVCVSTDAHNSPNTKSFENRTRRRTLRWPMALATLIVLALSFAALYQSGIVPFHAVGKAEDDTPLEFTDATELAAKKALRARFDDAITGAKASEQTGSAPIVASPERRVNPSGVNEIEVPQISSRNDPSAAMGGGAGGAGLDGGGAGLDGVDVSEIVLSENAPVIVQGQPIPEEKLREMLHGMHPGKIEADQSASSEKSATISESPNTIVLKGDERDIQEIERQIREIQKTAGISGDEEYRETIERQLREMQKAAQSLSGEDYRETVENPFIQPIGSQAVSTFSIDVDTASYANVRRFLMNGQLPPPAAVRVEELINYFQYDYATPEESRPFAVHLQLAACPWNTNHQLLRVALKGKEIRRDVRPPSNLVFLVDVSGSMSSDDKLPLLRRGLAMLVEQLSENDMVSIVTYAGDAGVRLRPTNGTDKRTLLDAIETLSPGGSTNGSAGIEMAYRLAEENFLEEGANRVILATDGDLNVGVTDDDSLVNLIKEKAAGGVFLTVLGFGTGNLKDAKLEGLADNGNGIYAYIDSLREARKVLVEQMSGSLVTIAKDVKLQIEFNPAHVRAYRLIGYENRILAAQDFANDRKDAGDIGAGHSVTAFYEIVPAGNTETQPSSSVPLKYQATEADAGQPNQARPENVNLTESGKSDELARVLLRYKLPEATESQLLEFVAHRQPLSFSETDNDFRFATTVAAFGMFLRQSKHVGDFTLAAVEEMGVSSLGRDPNGTRAEFVDLVRRARALSGR